MRVGLGESSDGGVVVAGAEVIRPRFAVPVFAAVAEGVGVVFAGVFLVAEGVVGVGPGNSAARVRQIHHVPVGVEEIIFPVPGDEVRAAQISCGELTVDHLCRHAAAVQQEHRARLAGLLAQAQPLRVVSVSRALLSAGGGDQAVIRVVAVRRGGRAGRADGELTFEVAVGIAALQNNLNVRVQIQQILHSLFVVDGVADNVLPKFLPEIHIIYPMGIHFIVQ